MRQGADQGGAGRVRRDHMPAALRGDFQGPRTGGGSGSRACAVNPEICAMVLVAARRWREARDAGERTQPCIAEALVPFGRVLLTPVLDSLLAFYEAALARPIRCGFGATSSPDEMQLLALLEGHTFLSGRDRSASAATLLDCALASARIMVAITPGRREGSLS